MVIDYLEDLKDKIPTEMLLKVPNQVMVKKKEDSPTKRTA